MNPIESVEAVETIGPPPIVVRPDVPGLLAQGGITVAIQLCGALLLWQVRALLKGVQQSLSLDYQIPPDSERSTRTEPEPD